jgi:hypothetical protein
VYRGDCIVPGELPDNADSYRIQQNRWAKGTIQVAGKLLSTIMRSNLRPVAKYEAFLRRREEAEGRKLPVKVPAPEVLEILEDVWTDSEGNILVYKKTECLEDCALAVRAYSPQGDFLCDFMLEPGPFVLSGDWRFKRLVLTEGGLYGLLEFKDDPDGFLHLIRMVFRLSEIRRGPPRAPRSSPVHILRALTPIPTRNIVGSAKGI